MHNPGDMFDHGTLLDVGQITINGDNEATYDYVNANNVIDANHSIVLCKFSIKYSENLYWYLILNDEGMSSVGVLQHDKNGEFIEHTTKAPLVNAQFDEHKICCATDFGPIIP